MERIRIRDLKIQDATDVMGICASIVRDPMNVDFNALIKKHVQNKKDICLVAECESRVVGFMISYTLNFGLVLKQAPGSPLLA